MAEDIVTIGMPEAGMQVVTGKVAHLLMALDAISDIAVGIERRDCALIFSTIAIAQFLVVTLAAGDDARLDRLVNRLVQRVTRGSFDSFDAFYRSSATLGKRVAQVLAERELN
jgi:hypothetical protein